MVDENRQEQVEKKNEDGPHGVYKYLKALHELEVLEFKLRGYKVILFDAGETCPTCGGRGVINATE